MHSGRTKMGTVGGGHMWENHGGGRGGSGGERKEGMAKTAVFGGEHHIVGLLLPIKSMQGRWYT